MAKMKNGWRSMSRAPKHNEGSIEGPHILGINKLGEQRVIYWTTEYPHDEGVWGYAEAPNEYISDILTFEPVAWQHLPKGDL